MKDINMPPYDGVDYRYTSADPDREKAISIIKNILGFMPKNDGLDYSLNFYSGGIGVDDRLAIRCKLDPSNWPAVMGKLLLKSPSEALSDPGWSEEFVWLVSEDEESEDIRNKCCNFINVKKQRFQDAVDEQGSFLFTNESNVNSWCVVWVVNDNLNYLSFDQG